MNQKAPLATAALFGFSIHPISHYTSLAISSQRTEPVGLAFAFSGSKPYHSERAAVRAISEETIIAVLPAV
jgi:hypothetical protein